jgi:DNA (cytosine-5)-methyltransferase 1
MKILDLFSGCGGLSLGFEQAGLPIQTAFDFWPSAVKTYELNFTHPIELLDLSTPEAATYIAGLQADIIIGGPPCQDFSSAGKRDENLGRGDLSVAFAQIVAQSQPSYFVMENVDRIIKSKKLVESKQVFQDAGYKMFAIVLDASFCGVPQSRKRFFLFGSKDLNPIMLEAIIQKNMSSRPMTVREYMGNRLSIDHYYRHPRSYQRRAIFSVDEPSPTIRGVNRPIPNGYPGHPGDPVPISSAVRPLTFEERAEIQTFPPDFKFWGNKSEREQQIGNAVPVKLAKFVATCLAQYIELKTRSYEFAPSAETFAMEPIA